MEKRKFDSQFDRLADFRFPMKKEIMPGIQHLLKAQKFPANDRLRFGESAVVSYDGYKVPVTVLCPENSVKDAPCLIYFHGGGFVFPADETQYKNAERYAIGAGCRIVFPDYRLCPEYAYPAAHEDCFAVYKWVIDNAEMLGIDRNRVAVGGDSAGGNLAAGVLLMARDRGVELPCFQMLIYPVTDRRMNTESAKTITDAPVWDSRHSEILWQWYTPELKQGEFCYASPNEAESLNGMPDTYIEVADFDSLRDEGIEYAKRLSAAGVNVQFCFNKGTVHGFEYAGDTPIVMESIKRRCEVLKEALHNKA